MLVFPNCKINLGLHVKNKRADEYHEIETVFYPILIHDALEIIDVPPTADLQETSLAFSGTEIEGVPGENLCLKAFRLLKKDFPFLPNVSIQLHKAIPVGAGLGGGSADGAFALTTLNKKYELDLTRDRLVSYALQLGSDCPFFIYNLPSLATGRGEVLREISLTLSGYRLILVYPGIHINTGSVFTKLNATRAGQTDQLSSSPIEQIIAHPVEEWKDQLVNDLETPVFEQYPQLNNIKKTLYNSGALYASMSGSGSSVYGIFNIAPEPYPAFPLNYSVWSVLL